MFTLQAIVSIDPGAKRVSLSINGRQLFGECYVISYL